MSEFTAALWLDPSRCAGRVCLNGTRLYTEHTAHMLSFDTVEQYRSDYGLEGISDRDIYVAAAWWVLYEPARTKQDRALKKAWHQWATGVWEACWHHEYVPEPPPDFDVP